MLGDATLSYGEALTGAFLGLEALYASEQGKGQRGAGGDIERLVVFNMSTTHQSAPVDSYADGRARFGELLARHRSGLGTRAAWRLHAEGWSPDKVRDELHRDALVGGEGWVDARMRFISRHDRAALIWSYWHGGPSVAAVWDRVRDTPDRHAPYFDHIYGRMHSPQSIALFQA